MASDDANVVEKTANHLPSSQTTRPNTTQHGTNPSSSTTISKLSSGDNHKAKQRYGKHKQAQPSLSQSSKNNQSVLTRFVDELVEDFQLSPKDIPLFKKSYENEMDQILGQLYETSNFARYNSIRSVRDTKHSLTKEYKHKHDKKYFRRFVHFFTDLLTFLFGIKMVQLLPMHILVAIWSTSGANELNPFAGISDVISTLFWAYFVPSFILLVILFVYLKYNRYTVGQYLLLTVHSDPQIPKAQNMNGNPHKFTFDVYGSSDDVNNIDNKRVKFDMNMNPKVDLYSSDNIIDDKFNENENEITAITQMTQLPKAGISSSEMNIVSSDNISINNTNFNFTNNRKRHVKGTASKGSNLESVVSQAVYDDSSGDPDPQTDLIAKYIVSNKLTGPTTSHTVEPAQKGEKQMSQNGGDGKSHVQQHTPEFVLPSPRSQTKSFETSKKFPHVQLLGLRDAQMSQNGGDDDPGGSGGDGNGNGNGDITPMHFKSKYNSSDVFVPVVSELPVASSPTNNIESIEIQASAASVLNVVTPHGNDSPRSIRPPKLVIQRTIESTNTNTNTNMHTMYTGRTSKRLYLDVGNTVRELADSERLKYQLLNSKMKNIGRRNSVFLKFIIILEYIASIFLFLGRLSMSIDYINTQWLEFLAKALATWSMVFGAIGLCGFILKLLCLFIRLQMSVANESVNLRHFKFLCYYHSFLLTQVLLCALFLNIAFQAFGNFVDITWKGKYASLGYSLSVFYFFLITTTMILAWRRANDEMKKISNNPDSMMISVVWKHLNFDVFSNRLHKHTSKRKTTADKNNDDNDKEIQEEETSQQQEQHQTQEKQEPQEKQKKQNRKQDKKHLSTVKSQSGRTKKKRGKNRSPVRLDVTLDITTNIAVIATIFLVVQFPASPVSLYRRSFNETRQMDGTINGLLLAMLVSMFITALLLQRIVNLATDHVFSFLMFRFIWTFCLVYPFFLHQNKRSETKGELIVEDESILRFSQICTAVVMITSPILIANINIAMAKMLTMPHTHLIIGLTIGTLIVSGIKVAGIALSVPFSVELGSFMILHCLCAFVPMFISICVKRIVKTRELSQKNVENSSNARTDTKEHTLALRDASTPTGILNQMKFFVGSVLQTPHSESKRNINWDDEIDDIDDMNSKNNYKNNRDKKDELEKKTMKRRLMIFLCRIRFSNHLCMNGLHCILMVVFWMLAMIGVTYSTYGQNRDTEVQETIDINYSIDNPFILTMTTYNAHLGYVLSFVLLLCVHAVLDGIHDTKSVLCFECL